MHIFKLISAEESRLAELDRELERLKRERSEYASDLRKHKSIVGPIRRVPPEIVREIFLLVLDLDFDFELECHRDFPHAPSRNEAPLLLGHICSTWRQVCIEFPRLWNRIIVSFNSENHHRMVHLVKIWLNRAQSLPLSLVVRPGHKTEVNHLSQMIDILLPYFPQLKRLYIDLVDGFIPCLGNSHPSMPVFEHLSVSLKMNMTEGRHGFVWTNTLTAFEDAPHLKSVELSADFLIGQMEIQKLNISWSRLTQLIISDYKFYPFLFPQCINLEQCSLNFSDSGVSFPNNAPTTVLPRLQELSLFIEDSMFIASDVLDTLTLPALRTLYFNDLEDHDFPIDNFVALQARSHFELISLSLTALSFRSLNPKELFHTIKSLVSLSLEFCKCPSKVLKALTYNKKDSDPLLPCLQELTIDDDDDHDPSNPLFQTQHLVDMVESRWWPETDSILNRPIARLRKVHVEVQGRLPTLSEYERIERLREAGLDFEIID